MASAPPPPSPTQMITLLSSKLYPYDLFSNTVSNDRLNCSHVLFRLNKVIISNSSDFYLQLQKYFYNSKKW